MKTIDSSVIAADLHAIYPGLALEIAAACEQAYRRGYQQGSLYGTEIPEAMIADWRFSYPYELAVSPPDNRGESAGFSCTSFYRLEMETSNMKSAVFRELVEKTENPYEKYDKSTFGYLHPDLIEKFKKH